MLSTISNGAVALQSKSLYTVLNLSPSGVLPENFSLFVPLETYWYSYNSQTWPTHNFLFVRALLLLHVFFHSHFDTVARKPTTAQDTPFLLGQSLTTSPCSSRLEGIWSKDYKISSTNTATATTPKEWKELQRLETICSTWGTFACGFKRGKVHQALVSVIF